MGNLSSTLPLPKHGPGNGRGDDGVICHRFLRGGRGSGPNGGGGGTDAATCCVETQPTLGVVFGVRA
eukprot:9358194-Lingulodinium_polyedra.AAC.1